MSGTYNDSPEYHMPMINQLYHNNVVDIQLDEEKYSVTLSDFKIEDSGRITFTKEMLVQLIRELQHIHDAMYSWLKEDPNAYTTGPDYDY